MLGQLRLDGMLEERMYATMQVSPDRKWISMGRDDWIYILDEKDKLVDPSGKELPFTPGAVPQAVVAHFRGDDMLRVTWPSGDTTQPIFYQYLPLG